MSLSLTVAVIRIRILTIILIKQGRNRKRIMENFDDDMDFNSEQVQKIAQQAVELVVGSDNIVYQKDKVN